MLKKTSLVSTTYIILAFAMPTISHATGVQMSDGPVGNIFFHITAIILSIIAAIYMATLSATFKGGLFEKIWKRFTAVAVAIACLSIVIYLDEASILHIDYLHEIILILISTFLIAASYRTLGEMIKK